MRANATPASPKALPRSSRQPRKLTKLPQPRSNSLLRTFSRLKWLFSRQSVDPQQPQLTNWNTGLRTASANMVKRLEIDFRPASSILDAPWPHSYEHVKMRRSARLG